MSAEEEPLTWGGIVLVIAVVLVGLAVLFVSCSGGSLFGPAG